MFIQTTLLEKFVENLIYLEIKVSIKMKWKIKISKKLKRAAKTKDKLVCKKKLIINIFERKWKKKKKNFKCQHYLKVPKVIVKMFYLKVYYIDKLRKITNNLHCLKKKNLIESRVDHQ